MRLLSTGFTGNRSLNTLLAHAAGISVTKYKINDKITDLSNI